jgi:hypothetical protein
MRSAIMARYEEDDEREKPSWREIDRKKDRPYAPKEPPKERRPSQRTDWMRKQYRKEADKLFLGKKGTKKYQKAVEEMDNLRGTDQFDGAAKTFLDEFGLPDDWSTLSLLLDYSDAEQVIQVLNKMRDLYGKRTTGEQQGFRAKLQILGMTATDSEVRDLAEEMLKAL